MIDIAHGLTYLHSKQIYHGDIYPNNIYLNPNQTYSIQDHCFLSDHQTALKRVYQQQGFAYMAPEQITGEPIDRRTDLYSLGALLYIMLTFRRSIEADSVAGFLARHLTEVPKAPSDFNPHIPRRLEQICQRLLMKDPAQRFQSARQVLQLLDSNEETTRIPLRGRNREMAEWNEQLRLLKDGAGGSVALC